MMDYDAKAAFDPVLSGLTIITCQRMGLPRSASIFMFQLLKHGLERSALSFHNDKNPNEIGQGVLQGSSSTSPIYTLTTDVPLTAYSQLGTEAGFTHPIHHHLVNDFTVRYVMARHNS